MPASISEPLAGAVLEAAERPARRSDRRSGRRLVCGLALAFADLVAVQAALLLAIQGIQVLQGSSTGAAQGVGWSPALGAAAAFGVLIPAGAFGLYDPARSSPLERFRLRIYAVGILPALGLAVLTLAQPGTLDLLLVLVATAFLFFPLAATAESLACRALIAKSVWGTDVLVVGSGDVAARVTADLLAHPQTGLRPIGYCGAPVELGAELGAELGTARLVPCLGSFDDLEGLGGVADVAVVALSPEMRTLDLAQLPFRRIVLVPDIHTMPADWVRTRALGSVAGFDFANPARARTHLWTKRLLDCLIAAPVLLLTLPVILGTAAAIRVLSPGPAFYVQHRVGWRGRPVRILKLRSMYFDADRRLAELLLHDAAARQEWETYVKLSRDPRILPFVGHFIRKTSIDELPQLWNVVRGDISFVGPRPFPAYHIEKFPPEFQALRCSVRPGLTGLWQVSDRSGADLEQQEAIDTFYIRNWSIWLDLYVVFRTLPAILRARGAR